jgi:hypothetical protein
VPEERGYKAQDPQVRLISTKKSRNRLTVLEGLFDPKPRRQVFFGTENVLAAECARLKARKNDLEVSLTAITSTKIAEASEAYKLSAPTGRLIMAQWTGQLTASRERSNMILFFRLSPALIWGYWNVGGLSGWSFVARKFHMEVLGTVETEPIITPVASTLDFNSRLAVESRKSQSTRVVQKRKASWFA